MSGAITEGDGSLNQLFRAYRISSFPGPEGEGVTSIASNMSIAEACSVLSKNKILSAPVRNIAEDELASWKDKYYGVADFMTMVEWMMDKSWGISPASLDALMSLKDAFHTTPVTALMSTWMFHPYTPLTPRPPKYSRLVHVDPIHNTFLDIMFLLGKYGAHRVYVARTHGGDLMNIITQSDVIKMLHEHSGQLPQSLLGATLAELHLGDQDVVTVKATDSYWDAFRVMNDKFVSAVAVTEHHKYVGCISSSHDIAQMVLDPVKFRAMAHPIGTHELQLQDRELYTCASTDTLQRVLAMMATSGVHRLFILDDKRHIKGVVTPRDIIARFVKEPAESMLFEQAAASS